jgi:aspartyl-tRNA(Asn)/glutamyl-tRNA(Gln) amidotransferase subunit B
LEEDAGKSMHDQDLKDSLIDLNRAGVPLIEIVSEPDIRSSEEAGVYLTEIRKILRYLEICDGNMEEGSMRCDANISVRKIGENTYGNRCEVKNLNSIRNVQKAIDFEAKRQIEVLESGGKIEQNTLNFDALTGITTVLRSKEMANDYRYFPEPDLPPLIITEKYIEGVRSRMPMLPEEWLTKLTKEYELSAVEASILVDHREIASYFLLLCAFFPNFKIAYNWLLGPIKSYLNDNALEIQDFPLIPEKLAEIMNLVSEGKVNYTLASTVLLKKLIENPNASPLDIASREHLLINHDENELDQFIQSALQKYPDKVEEYLQGKKGVLGLFMGEIMKLSQGKIDPKLANSILLKTLETYSSLEK